MMIHLALFLGGIVAAAFGAKGLAKELDKKPSAPGQPAKAPASAVPSFAPAEPQSAAAG